MSKLPQPGFTRVLPRNYRPEKWQINSAIQQALQDGLGNYLVIEGYRGGKATAKIRVEVWHAIPGDDGWSKKYQGDPAGRTLLKVFVGALNDAGEDSCWFEMYCNAPNIYSRYESGGEEAGVDCPVRRGDPRPAGDGLRFNFAR